MSKENREFVHTKNMVFYSFQKDSSVINNYSPKYQLI